MKSLTVACALLLCSPAALAGVITWGSAQNTTDPMDVATTGTVVEAVNATDSNAGTVTVNGVTFQNSDSLLNQTFAGGALGTGGASTGDTAYDSLLDTFDYGNGNSTSIDIANGLLSAGVSYLIQVWFTDLRGCCSGRDMIYGDGMGNTVTLNASGAGLGQYAIGTFKATSQSLSLETGSFRNAHITGYQVRDVPEPASLALMGLGLLAAAGIGSARRK